MLINQTPAQLRLNAMSTQFTTSMVIFSFPFEYCENIAFLLFLWNFPKTFQSQLQSSKGFLLGGSFPVVVSFNFVFLPLITFGEYSPNHINSLLRGLNQQHLLGGWLWTIQTDELEVLGFRWKL